MRRTFRQTRGRRGDPGRDSQSLGGGQSPNQTALSFYLHHTFQTVPIHLPNHQPCCQGGTRKTAIPSVGSPHPTPSPPAWVGLLRMVQLGWNLRATHSVTPAFLPGSCREKQLQAEPTVSSFYASLPGSTFLAMPHADAHKSLYPSLVNSAGSFPRLHAPWSKLCACELFTCGINE